MVPQNNKILSCRKVHKRGTVSVSARAALSQALDAYSKRRQDERDGNGYEGYIRRCNVVLYATAASCPRSKPGYMSVQPPRRSPSYSQPTFRYLICQTAAPTSTPI